jgi:1-acyl-sn-glycerol-3-phosphate acyltransferase
MEGLPQMAKSTTNATAAATAQAIAPQGQRLGRAAGPGMLNPGAGIASIKAGAPIFCGRIVGLAHSYFDHPNSKDPKKTSTRFSGEFLCVDPTGKQSMHMETYLPNVYGNGVRAVLSRPNAEPVQFALEVWAEPDEFTGRKTAQGYEYAVYNRNPHMGMSPVQRLAIESGIIEAPALPTPGLGVGAAEIDPETGEVTHPSQRPA